MFGIFCEASRGVKFPETGADLWGGPENFLGNSGNLRGSLGNPGNFWIALKVLNGRSVKEVAKELQGKFGEIQGIPEAQGNLIPSQRPAKRVFHSLRGLEPKMSDFAVSGLW